MKIFTNIILISLFLSSAIACTNDKVETEESTLKERKLVNEGNEYMESGKYDEALDAYKDAIEENSKSEVAKFNTAIANEALGQDSVAARTYIELATSPNRHIAESSIFNLGNMAMRQGDALRDTTQTAGQSVEYYKQAIEYYKELLRKNPSNIKARQNLLVAQLRIPDSPDQQQQQQQDQQQQNQNQQQQQQQQQNQDQQQQQNQKEQEQQQQQQNLDQLLNSVQNKENETHQKIKDKDKDKDKDKTNGSVRRNDKPW